MIDSWVDTVSARLGPPIVTTSDEVRFNCFRRDCVSKRTGQMDDGWHMYLNPSKGKFFCQRCRKGGSLQYLAKVLGIQSPDSALSMWDRIINEFMFGAPVPEPEQPVVMPDDYVKIFPGSRAHKYLIDRAIPESKIEVYELGFGTGDLKNRIIFPDRDKDGKLVYWVARTYGKHLAKYKNAKSPRESKIFNLGRLQASGYRDRVVITEGPISCMMAGSDAVATYGKYVTGTQISMLAGLEAEEYVIALDGDAVGESISLATRLWKRGLKCRVVRMAYGEDPASIGTLEMRRRIKLATRWGGFSALEVLL